MIGRCPGGGCLTGKSRRLAERPEDSEDGKAGAPLRCPNVLCSGFGGEGDE